MRLSAVAASAWGMLKVKGYRLPKGAGGGGDMNSGSPTSLLRSVLGLALCAVATASCATEPQPSQQRPTARVSLMLRVQPEGVFTLRVADLEAVTSEKWREDHYGRIARKLTPSDVGAGEVKDISVEGQQLTIRTQVKDAADCEQQAERIERLLSGLYEETELVSATTDAATSSDLDEIEQILEARAEAAGLSDLSVQPRPPDALSVEFACADGPEWAKELLTARGLLQLRIVPRQYADGTDNMPDVSYERGKTVHTFRGELGTEVDVAEVIAESPVIVSGTDFLPRSHAIVLSGRPTAVTFELREGVREEFEAFTRAHVNRYLAIIFDGELISCPIIRSAVPGEGVIEGGFDRPGGKEAAERLAILINSRPMPFGLECVESTTEQLRP